MLNEELSDDEQANAQRQALEDSISSLYTFNAFATKSRFAIPAEVDNAIELLNTIKELTYGE